MGGVFARGFLKAGYSITPVTRAHSIETCAMNNPEPDAVLVAVGEKDSQPILTGMPETWRGRLILLQNELLPND